MVLCFMYVGPRIRTRRAGRGTSPAPAHTTNNRAPLPNECQDNLYRSPCNGSRVPRAALSSLWCLSQSCSFSYTKNRNPLAGVNPKAKPERQGKNPHSEPPRRITVHRSIPSFVTHPRHMDPRRVHNFSTTPTGRALNQIHGS